jgi:hypothetical protein
MHVRGRRGASTADVLGGAMYIVHGARAQGELAATGQAKPRELGGTVPGAFNARE